MVINTPKPISRDERYLSKIGGNEEVIVPKPISREEKYMYRAAGYDDQPIPDYPISRKEKYWAKIIENGGGSGNGSTVTFDSGQKFISDNSSLKDYKIYGNGGEIHPTGVLPLTFTAKGGTAVDWVIYGNDELGENLFDVPAKSVTSNNNYYAEVVISEIDVISYFNQHLGDTFSFAYDIITEYTGDIRKELVIYFTDSTFKTIRDALSITITKTLSRIGIRTRYDNPAGNGINYTFNHFMIVKGSTAPDHYIPYQQGVGERTANVMPSAVNGTYTSGRGTVICNNGVYTFKISAGTGSVSIIVPIPEFTMPVSVGQGGNGVLYFLNDKAKSNIAIPFIYNGSSVTSDYMPFIVNRVINDYGTTETKQCNGIQFYAANSVGDYEITISPMFITDGIAPDHYIPYGYEIPISVNNTQQTFYIGDSPLTAGQSISKTSTGVDITTQVGENTVSTTLYNKPTMEIETSYGVGVKDNNHYIIPFKVNTTIYNIQIGDSPLYDGEYLSYKEKKLYKYIDSVLTPIDPPSPFPEISTTEGVNKVIIETSTQPDSIFITTQNPIKLVQPNIGTKTITQNGVYNASDDNLDGYSSVTVNTN